MAQNTILAAGTNAAISNEFSLPIGKSITVGAFVESGNIPSSVFLNILLDTPGEYVSIGKLTQQNPAFILIGPGTFKVSRSNIADFGIAVGAFTEDA